MGLVQIITLALIQGLTEFLPVSSSAHLILGARLFSWPDQGLVFDVATHLGTLFAVLVYFRRDLMAMAAACIDSQASPGRDQQRRLAILLAAASVPGLVLGYLAKDLVELYLRDLRIIAWSTLIFGVLLWWADWRGPKRLSLEQIGWRQALWIGLAQACALIPGASRSGVTITAGRLLGLTTEAAARFSFLLSIPIIGAAGSYGALKVATGSAAINWSQFWLAAGLSALAGWLCIAAFLALLRRVGLVPFVLYRLALGGFLLWLLS